MNPTFDEGPYMRFTPHLYPGHLHPGDVDITLVSRIPIPKGVRVRKMTMNSSGTLVAIIHDESKLKVRLDAVPQLVAEGASRL